MRVPIVCASLGSVNLFFNATVPAGTKSTLYEAVKEFAPSILAPLVSDKIDKELVAHINLYQLADSSDNIEGVVFLAYLRGENKLALQRM